MLVRRSSSTPILGSLLLSSSSSFTDSPKHNLFSSSHSDKISFTHSLGGHPICCNIPTYPSSCSSSPFDKESHNKSVGGFRRAQSDGNLEGLLAQEGIQLNSSRKSFRKGMLETIPSFSIYSKKELEDEEEEEEEEEDLSLQRSVTIGENISMLGGGNEGDGFMKFVMTQVKEDEEEGGDQPVSPSMFLACGLGIDLSGGGDFGGFNEFGMDKGKGDESDLGEHYQKMVEQDPSNPLFLRNYAQFLYQTMGDLPRAEEYYSRAILSDPGDGEVMSQYAKIVWELHRDLERASTYFERAVQVSPQDSHVHAAYASFLWETEDDDNVEEGNLCQGLIEVPLFRSGVITSSMT